MIISVDFDGTIVEHNYPKIGKELPRAVETLIDLKNKGNHIILWTCRSGYHVIAACNWLTDRGFTPDKINCNVDNVVIDYKFNSPKIYADVYIDDKNLGGFCGWGKVREMFNLD